MSNTRIVLAQGAIDGINTVFATGVPYVTGSTAYILNGRVHNQALARGPDNPYGFVELDPDSGTIQVDTPPETDDVVQIFYADRRVTPPAAITHLTGVVHTAAAQNTTLIGVIHTPTVTRLVGIIKERC
jgi:hypothetical protein